MNTHTQTRTHTLGRTPLDGGSACNRDLSLNDTQHSWKTHTHAPGRIWTRDSSQQPATRLRVRPHAQWD